jgi:hypothetical protein
MTRSTVQDKISGKSPPRLGQILALVQACADYARSIDAPLPPEDTDEQVWRERVHAMSVRTPPPSPAPKDVSLSPSARWDLDPLIRAGMYDMVDLVQASEHQPMANWLPSLIQALGSAGMSNEQFLRAASTESPPDVVASILAVAASQEEKTVERLIYLCAANQPAEDIPAIIVLLRRKGRNGAEVWLPGLLIEVLTGNLLASQSNIGPAHYVSIVSALRSATMERDATQVLKDIGKRGDADLVLELAASFPDRLSGDRETILSSVAKGSSYHLKSLLKALRTTAPAGIDPKRTLDRIIFGIPHGKNQKIASDLESDGMHEEAQRVLELEDEPPF